MVGYTHKCKICPGKNLKAHLRCQIVVYVSLIALDYFIKLPNFTFDVFFKKHCEIGLVKKKQVIGFSELKKHFNVVVTKKF